jgi:hypothetical protein
MTTWEPHHTKKKKKKNLFLSIDTLTLIGRPENHDANEICGPP